MFKKINNFISSKLMFCLIFLTIMAIISFNIPLIADDFSLSISQVTNQPIKNLYDIFESVKDFYLNWNGRILGYFLSELSLIGNRQLFFRLVYPIINLIIVLEVKDLIFEEKNNTYLFLVGAIFLSPHVLTMSQTMFWIIGWSTYVFPLIFIIYLINYFKNVCSKSCKCFNKVTLFVSSFAGCLFVEHYALIIFGLSIMTIMVEIYRYKKIKISKETIYFLVGAIFGLLTIFAAPGLLNRASTDLTANFTMLKKFHFGWTRFIYNYFYLNQRIFIVVSLTLIIANYKYGNCKLAIIFNVLHLPILTLAVLLMFFPRVLNPYMLECLTGEWSFYTCELKNIIIYSSFVVYNLLVLLSNTIYLSLKEKNAYLFTLYGAAVMSSLCFVLSNLACERTQYISYVLLAIIGLEVYSKIDFKNFLKKTMLIASIMMFALLSTKYISNYYGQYQIYLRNENRYQTCAINKCQEVFVEDFNYNYIFKSDYNYDDQFNWLMDAIRHYYCLPSNTFIEPIIIK